MPGGRVQPVFMQKKHSDFQKKQQTEVTKLAQLEETRRRAVAAQQALILENTQKMEQIRLEQKQRDDDRLRRQHEQKLNETAGDELGRQQEADEELKRFQAAGLQRERAAAALKREQEALIENARRAALEEKKSENTSTPAQVTEPVEPEMVAAVANPDPAPTHSEDVTIDIELATIRDRINNILNSAD